MFPYGVIAVLVIAAASVGIYLIDNYKLARKQTSGTIMGKLQAPGRVEMFFDKTQNKVRPVGISPSYQVLIDTPHGRGWLRVPRGYFTVLQTGFVGIAWYTRTRITKRINIETFEMD